MMSIEKVKIFANNVAFDKTCTTTATAKRREDREEKKKNKKKILRF